MASDNSTNRPTMQGQRCGNCAVGRQIEAPAWMATKESIDREAALCTQSKLDSLMARTGGWVTIFTNGAILEDRSTGVVLMRMRKRFAVGDITKRLL